MRWTLGGDTHPFMAMVKAIACEQNLPPAAHAL